MKNPDLTKIADISKRLDAEQKKPGYSMEVFNRFVGEANEAVGDDPEFLEFLGPYIPSKQASPAPSAANVLATSRR